MYSDCNWVGVMKYENVMINYENARKIMPGGNGLLSKRPSLKSANYPQYARFAKGHQIWTDRINDIGTQVFQDFHLMGIGCCTLGYANTFVNNAVCDVIWSGNMTSLNCPEEYELAQRLLTLDKIQEMVRFSRLGCDAVSQAVRVARAYTGKTKILYRGYHGWHDWYMAGAGNGQPNAGIPKCLTKKIAPYYLDADLSNIAAVVLEPALFDTNYLEMTRETCARWDVPLIYDEITSGFRMKLGSCTNITPDIEIYGKALGNGYPICAIVGQEYVMKRYDDTFISSTFNTERTGFAAGKATLDYMIKHNVQDTLIQNGKIVKAYWEDCAHEFGFEIKITGLDPLATFVFIEKTDSTTREDNKLMTLYQQEMVKKGFLAGSQYYASIAHKYPYMCEFGASVYNTFNDMAEENVKLEGRVAQSGVKHG